ncbi:MAG: hypothetical protein ACOCTT_03430 [archaeon]
MKFKNNSNKGIRVRIEKEDGYSWKSVEPNQVVDLPETVGLVNGLDKVEEEQKVDEEEILDEDFGKELQAIDGVGQKTARDIIDVYPTKEDLLNAVDNEDELPFRDDVSDKIKNKYG